MSVLGLAIDVLDQQSEKSLPLSPHSAPDWRPQSPAPRDAPSPLYCTRTHSRKREYHLSCTLSSTLRKAALLSSIQSFLSCPTSRGINRLCRRKSLNTACLMSSTCSPERCTGSS